MFQKKSKYRRWLGQAALTGLWIFVASSVAAEPPPPALAPAAPPPAAAKPLVPGSNVSGHDAAVPIADDGPTIRLTVVGRKGLDEPRYNFGSLMQGAKVTHIFTVRNDTKKMVLLDRVDASCSCTGALLLDDFHGKQPFLPPKGSARIQVTLDTAKLPDPAMTLLSGETSKQVFVYVAGQPVHASAVLEMRGRIAQGVAFDPPALEFGNVNETKGASRTIRVTYQAGLYVPGKTRLTVPGENRITITDLHPAESEAAAPQSLGQTVARTYRVSVLPHAAVGPLSGALIAENVSATKDSLSSDTGPAPLTVSLPYAGQIVGRVTAEPSNVIFGAISQRDGFGKPLSPAEQSRQRVRWILLLCPTLTKATAPAFWKQARAESISPHLKAKVVSTVSGENPKNTYSTTTPVASDPKPPMLADAHLPEGTFCWLRVTLLPTAPLGQALTDTVLLTFKDGSHMRLPVQASL